MTDTHSDPDGGAGPAAPPGPRDAAPPLPRFFSRVADAIGPVAGLRPDDLARTVGAVVVTVTIRPGAQDDPALHAQARLACNLLARLYLRLRICAPQPLGDELAALVRGIHPTAQVVVAPAAAAPPGDGPVLRLQPDPAPGPARQRPDEVRVRVSGWNVAVDAEATDDGPPEPLAALAGACLGAGEVFRQVFADRLGDRGRATVTPAEINLVTCGPGRTGLPRLPTGTDLTGTVLAGAGAVGQAFLLALRTAGPTGTLVVADHDSIDLPNLQRYVLTDDTSPGTGKTSQAAAAFHGTALTVEQVPARWGADPRTGPHRDTVAVALDSATDRIGVAAGLHRAVYNAWTQPEDLGWSRHESFGGDDPCPACAYWPDRPRPSDHELIAQALRQHPLRALLYLTHGTPIGAPLPAPADGVLQLPQAPGLEPPPDLGRWFQVPLAADLVTNGSLRPADLPDWAGRRLSEVYRDGVCAGGLVSAGPAASDREALVPLAHQSALAGVMLALQLLAARHAPLRQARPASTEGRIDLLRALPQTLPRPRRPSPRCLCRDPDMRTDWHEHWWTRSEDPGPT